MTEEEYLTRNEELSKEFERKQKDLDTEFALSNNTVEVGDIVADNSHTMRVEEILVDRSLSYSFPRAYFKGTRLTKKLTPFKSGEKAIVYNIKKHIRKDV